MDKWIFYNKVFVLLVFFYSLFGNNCALSKTIWHDPLKQSFSIVRGRVWQVNDKDYFRLPKIYKEHVRKEVWDISQQSAGLSIAFRSNAKEIKIKYAVKTSLSMPYMPATGVSGLDLYSIDVDGEQHWCAANMNFGDTITYIYQNLSCSNQQWGDEYHLYLPSQNMVKWLEIGISDKSLFSFIPISQEKPIIIYGASIVQGACASRPGMMWTNIIERELEHPVINLGFSGNGGLESEIFQILAENEAKLYIIDCLPNLIEQDTIIIYDRILKGIQILRAKNSVPILLVEHSGYMDKFSSTIKRNIYQSFNRELKKAFLKLQEQGVSDIYYLSKEEIGFTSDSQVDGIHPNDLGMRQYANAYIKKIHIIFKDGGEPTIFKARKQQRDSYDWNKRHEAVIQLNKTEIPDILMIGNSITHFWGGNPIDRSFGTKSWNDLFKGLKVHNMGFGWDRIENVLWRIYHGELDGFQAKKIFVLIGTNNLSINTNNEIILGIKSIVAAIHLRQPQAVIFIAGILPRKGFEKRIEQLNRQLEIVLHSLPAIYINLSEGLVFSDGKIRDIFFRDGLHPNNDGYSLIAKKIKSLLVE